MKFKKGDKVMFLGNLDHEPYWENEVQRLDLKPMQIVEVGAILRDLLYIDSGNLGILLPFEYFQKVEEEDYEVHENQDAPAAKCQACEVPDVGD